MTRAALLKCLVTATLSLLFAPVAAQGGSNALDQFLKESGNSFVLVNARLIDGTGAPARENETLVIEGGRITGVGNGSPIPDGAKRIDLAGHTVLPGLVMMHEHINYFSGVAVWDSMPVSVPKLLLAAGVTTARTAGAEAPQNDLNLKRRIDTGRAPGPRLFVTGAYLNGPSGGFLGDNVVETPEQAKAITAFWGSRGATSMKVYSAISPAALQGAVEEANHRGMHVAGHLGEISCSEAANVGIHTIEHGLGSCVKDFGIAPDAIGSFRYDPASSTAKALISLLVAKGVTIVATPAATEPFRRSEEELAMLSADQRQRFEDLVATRPPWLPSETDQASWNLAHREFEKHFVESGGRLLIGGDASDWGMVPGYANHQSMIALVRAGFTPLQVIRIATSDAASFLGASDQFGTIAAGKVADLLIVKGAPDRNMEDIRSVAYVFKDGRAFDPLKLRAAAKGLLGQH